MQQARFVTNVVYNRGGGAERWRAEWFDLPERKQVLRGFLRHVGAAPELDDEAASLLAQSLDAGTYSILFLGNGTLVHHSEGPTPTDFYMLDRCYYGKVCGDCAHTFVSSAVDLCSSCTRAARTAVRGPAGG